MNTEISNTIWNKVNAKTVTLSWPNEKRQAVLVKANDKVWIDASRWPIYDEDLDSFPSHSCKWFGNDLWIDLTSLDKLFSIGFNETRCCEWLKNHLQEIVGFSWETETQTDKQQLSVVKFYDDELLLVDVEGKPYVVMKRIVENLGLTWQSQILKIQEDSRYKKLHHFKVMRLPNDVQRRQILLLSLEMLPTWLFSVNANRVAKHLKDKICKYQAECSQALWLYWSQGSAVKTVNGPVALQEASVSNVDNTELVKLVLTMQEKQDEKLLSMQQQFQTQIVTLQQSMLQVQKQHALDRKEIFEIIVNIQEQHAQDRKDNNHNWRVMQRSLDRALDLLTLVVQPSSVYLSIVKFRETYRLSLDSYQSQQLGRQAKQLCEAQRLEVGQVVELDDGKQVTRTGYPLPVLIQACKTVAPNALLSN